MRFPKCQIFSANHIFQLLLIDLVVLSVVLWFLKTVPLTEIIFYNLVFKAKVFFPAGNQTQPFTYT